jgi:hypothetical protein
VCRSRPGWELLQILHGSNSRCKTAPDSFVPILSLNLLMSSMNIPSYQEKLKFAGLKFQTFLRLKLWRQLPASRLTFLDSFNLLLGNLLGNLLANRSGQPGQSVQTVAKADAARLALYHFPKEPLRTRRTALPQRRSNVFLEMLSRPLAHGH